MTQAQASKQSDPPPFDSTDPSATEERSPDTLPMSGLRVIDVGTFLAGPYAASMLANLVPRF